MTPLAEALKWLSSNEDIVTKRADKGSAVVVWDRDQYILGARRQLDNCEYYEPLSSNTTDQMKAELINMLLEARNENWISQSKT